MIQDAHSAMNETQFSTGTQRIRPVDLDESKKVYVSNSGLIGGRAERTQVFIYERQHSVVRFLVFSPLLAGQIYPLQNT